MTGAEFETITELKAAGLQTIELRIVELLQQDRYRWQELAQLALLVRREKLYLKRGIRSFTAWIKGIAEASGRQPSLFWRYLKAAVYYLRQVESEDIERISEIKAAPEALDRLEKIERQAPKPVFEAMRDKVLAGEATVLECRRMERQYRPDHDLSNRGRPLKALEGEYSHLGRWRQVQEQRVKEQEIEAAKQVVLKREQMLQLLRQSIEDYVLTWTRDCVRAPFVPRNHALYKGLKIPQEERISSLETLVVTRWDLTRPKSLFGVSTKSCVADFEQDSAWQHYFNLCHYFCLVIPDQDIALRELIQAETPGHVGLLCVDLEAIAQQNINARNSPIHVERLPQKSHANEIGLVYEALYDEILQWKH